MPVPQGDYARRPVDHGTSPVLRVDDVAGGPQVRHAATLPSHYVRDDSQVNARGPRRHTGPRKDQAVDPQHAATLPSQHGRNGLRDYARSPRAHGTPKRLSRRFSHVGASRRCIQHISRMGWQTSLLSGTENYMPPSHSGCHTCRRTRPGDRTEAAHMAAVTVQTTSDSQSSVTCQFDMSYIRHHQTTCHTSKVHCCIH